MGYTQSHVYKGNNTITELRAILQREGQNSLLSSSQPVNSLLILNQSVKLDYLGNSEIYFSYSFLYAKIIPLDF